MSDSETMPFVDAQQVKKTLKASGSMRERKNLAPFLKLVVEIVIKPDSEILYAKKKFSENSPVISLQFNNNPCR